jgi:hypothetical protein
VSGRALTALRSGGKPEANLILADPARRRAIQIVIPGSLEIALLATERP